MNRRLGRKEEDFPHTDPDEFYDLCDTYFKSHANVLQQTSIGRVHSISCNEYPKRDEDVQFSQKRLKFGIAPTRNGCNEATSPIYWIV